MPDLKSIPTKDQLPGFIIERTAKKMKQAFSKLLLELKAEFTVDQWIVLRILSKEGAMNQFEIAEKAFKDRPTITRIIDLLCIKKLVERTSDPKDRRRFLVHLTSKGTKQVQAILPLVHTFRNKAYEGLTNQEIENLKSIIDKIHSNLS